MAKKNVLFLCTGNSCRSQMAEGWARHFHNQTLDAHSAGIATHGMNPHAVAVMKEAGVDIAGQSSKLVSNLADQPIDLIVAVCAHADENCPAVLTDVKRVRVEFDDPPKLAEMATNEAEALNCYRRVRDKIRDFVRDQLPPMLD